jgi:hypothetical protein
MELIPVLSTIILIATISTFLLAIGAYILYKIRERKGMRNSVPVPSTVKAELLSPVESPVEVPGPIYVEPQPAASFKQQEGSIKQQVEQKPRAVQYSFQTQQNSEPVSDQTGKSPQSEKQRFLKYTTDGYIVPAKDKKSPGALKWK